jgi:hypothetical protein
MLAVRASSPNTWAAGIKAAPPKTGSRIKVSETGVFVVTGFKELGPNRLEALRVAEKLSGALVDAGEVRFGFTGKQLWSALDLLRAERGR